MLVDHICPAPAIGFALMVCCYVTAPAYGAELGLEVSPRQILLRELRQCLDGLGPATSAPASSPCALRKDVEVLVGASRAEIINALGEPDWGGAGDELGYHFYRLPTGWRGGGPELVLRFGTDSRCQKVEWILTR